jgi:tetratricopeptide (TPR) repeat protein
MVQWNMAEEVTIMGELRWLLVPAALVWLTGFESASLDRCLAETTIECALEEAIAAANAAENKHQRAMGLAYVARVQADIGRGTDAMKMLDEVLFLKRGIMDVAAQNALDSSVARVHALLGNPERAAEIAQGIGDPGRAALAYAWLAQAQAGAGDSVGARKAISLALVAAEDLPREQLAFPFSQLAVAQAYMGERDETLAIVDSALALSERFDRNLIQARIAAVAAVAESAVGEQDRAADSLERVKDILSRMETGNAPAKELGSVLAYLAWAQILTGDSASAFASMDSLKPLIAAEPDGFVRSNQLAAIALVIGKGQ